MAWPKCDIYIFLVCCRRACCTYQQRDEIGFSVVSESGRERKYLFFEIEPLYQLDISGDSQEEYNCEQGQMKYY